MRVLVTGGGGFVGKYIVDILQEKDHYVFNYDLPKYDILDEIMLSKVIIEKKIDCVIHNAAVADLYETEKDIDRNFEVNVEGTYIIGKVCKQYDIKLVFISTCCVYGNAHTSIEKEDHTIPATTEPYACSKMAGEYMLRGFDELKYKVLRIGTVYGPNMRESLFNYIALWKTHKGEPITVYGSGVQSRNYIYITDLINLIYKATIDMKYWNKQVFNVCSDESTSVLETIRIAHKVVGNAVDCNFAPARKNDIKKECISNFKTKQAFKWEPVVSYYDGMKGTYELDKRFQQKK